MNKIASDKKEQVIEILKKEMNYSEPLENYSQWVCAVALKKNETQVKGYIRFTARIVTLTNQSEYADGMDIEFTEQDRKMIIDPLYYENSPDLMGSPNGIAWVMELNEEVIYLEQLDPHEEELYLGRLKYSVYDEYSFDTLGSFNGDESIRGTWNIENLYAGILLDTLQVEKVSVEAVESEITPYEYRYVLKVTIDDTKYILKPNDRFSKSDIYNEIRSKIIQPILESKVTINRKVPIVNCLK